MKSKMIMSCIMTYLAVNFLVKKWKTKDKRLEDLSGPWQALTWPWQTQKNKSKVSEKPVSQPFYWLSQPWQFVQSKIGNFGSLYSIFNCTNEHLCASYLYTKIHQLGGYIYIYIWPLGFVKPITKLVTIHLYQIKFLLYFMFVLVFVIVHRLV
jgi:hypothetical protein